MNRTGLMRWMIIGIACTTALGMAAAQNGEMAPIPAGVFQMGDATGLGKETERPLHKVTLSSFQMGKREVTKAQWDSVRQWGITNGYSFDYFGSGKATNHPVHSVSWHDAVKWCNARSEMEGLKPCYFAGENIYKVGQLTPTCDWSATGYRLPTEAEWEYAARGGLAGNPFPWGVTNTIQHTRANYYSTMEYAYDTSRTRGYHPIYLHSMMPYTSPAGSFAPNEFGLFDMAGNVWEWCWDEYDGSTYSAAPVADPRGPGSDGLQRVTRGGSWRDRAPACRVSARAGEAMSAALNRVGFRVVLPVAP